MPVLAESVPGLLHVSLFLFFLGLGDLVSASHKVAITTITPIVICTVLYIFTTFAPALYPQSPYQNSCLWPHLVHNPDVLGQGDIKTGMGK